MKLPPYDDLSGDQDEAINLPLEGRYLVAGPPGSGKTVVALYRAQMLKKSRRTPAVLTYSRLLRQFMQPWMDELLLHEAVDTFHHWFYRFYLDNYRQRPPQLTKYNHDWDAVLKQFLADPPTRNRPDQLIVDEGQDLGRQFYLAARMVADSMLVLADENQRITETQSRLQDIETYAQMTKTVHLRSNYRNTREISAVAGHFFTGLRTGVPEAPARSGPLPVMQSLVDAAEEIEAIRRFAASRRNQSIGVLVPTSAARSAVVTRLGSNTVHPVQQYVGGQGSGAQPLDFSRPAITVATYASSKGLEFDAVFLPHLHLVKDDGEGIRMKYYVLCSRPRHELHVSYSGPGEPAIVNAFPRDLMDWRS